MGNLSSTIKTGGDSIHTPERISIGEDTDPKHPPDLPTINEARLVGFLQALKQLSKLQHEATDAQIDARQKMRQVGQKRSAVWTSDAAFMKEVQIQVAANRIDSGSKLIRLAEECQVARDGLGPLEQEGIEAEQRWEGSCWKLQQAEAKLFHEFEDEFHAAELFSLPSTSTTSSQDSASSDDEAHFIAQDMDQVASGHKYLQASVASSSSFNVTDPQMQTLFTDDFSQEDVLLGLKRSDGLHLEVQDSPPLDSDSGIGDIDHIPERDEKFGSPLRLPNNRTGSLEGYPHLLTDFGSRRDRINKWLEHGALVSRSGATLLKNQLQLENPSNPSNWSQLVIAYWELDAASSRHPVLQKNHLTANLRNGDVQNMESVVKSQSERSPLTWLNGFKFKPRSLLTSRTSAQAHSIEKLPISLVDPSTVRQLSRFRSHPDIGQKGN